jgi:hypothetical protein
MRRGKNTCSNVQYQQKDLTIHGPEWRSSIEPRLPSGK